MRAHDPAMRRIAGSVIADSQRVEAALLEAYLDAYRALPALDPEASVERWLAELVRRSCASAPAGGGFGEQGLWPRLADALAAEAPALAPPELPRRRFPVVPDLQRRRRGKGPG